MSNAYTSFAASKSPAKAVTPATQKIPGRESEMAANNGGGVSFLLDDWGVYDRFLLIGSESGGYNAGKPEGKVAQSFDVTKRVIAKDGLRAVARALEISVAGRAPKNDPAVVAIALAAVFGDQPTKDAAYAALPKIARTGTWLFQFVSILDSMGKWNAAAKRGVSKWYTEKQIDKLAVQMLKYQQRDGWSHRDVLRLAHVKPSSAVQSNLFKYAVKGADAMEVGSEIPKLVVDFERLKRTDKKSDILEIIDAQRDVSWEMVPTQWLKDKDILTALVANMGLTAVIRKLGILTQHGVIAPLSSGSKEIIAKLQDVESLRRQRVHPITLLQAYKQYLAGHGEKGSAVWTPDRRVADAVNEAFYAAFGAIETTDENYMIGVDCSGSMWMASHAKVNGSPNLLAGEVAGVMALAIAKKQPNHFICGFNNSIGELKISPNMTLDQVMDVMRKFPWGSTNPSLLFKYAQANKMDADKFITITDNDINTGVQPVHALRDYRQARGRNAKCVVVATSMSQFTIADPKDRGMLDIAGFDSAAPQLIASL